MSRIEHSVKNAKVTLLFNLGLLFLNFFSRRVFIEVLGAELIGVSATVQSYIGMLNLADLGITGAIAVALYTPLFNFDKKKINEIVSIYGYLFRRVGIFIGIAGIVMSLFLPLLFAKESIAMWQVYLAFYSFLTTTLLSYLVNYKQNLLVANQKNYVITTLLNMSNIAKVVIQIVLLKWCGAGFVTWLLLEVVFAVVFAILLERRIKKEYPWLKANLKKGRGLLKEYPEIVKNIKQVFSHKIAGFVQQQSNPIVIQLLLGAAMVTHYGNYMVIAGRLTLLVVATFTSNTAGVGNLIAEGNKGKTKLVFWQMNAMMYWIGGIAAFGFYTFASPLVVLWIPGANIFSGMVVMLMTFNIYVYIVRQPVIYFVNGYGIFSDTASAWIEAILSLSISIVLGIMYGMVGVIAGVSVGLLVVVMIWRPHYLYTRGFKEGSGAEYWLNILKYVVVLGVVWFGADFLSDLIFENDAGVSWVDLIVRAVVIAPIFAIVYGAALWVVSPGMKAFVKLGIDLIRKRIR